MIAQALSRLLPVNIGNALTLTEFLDRDLLSLVGGELTQAASGVKVTHGSALKVGAVWQAVSMISGDIATMPFHVYRKLDDGFRDVDEEHDVDYLISVQPNEEMSAFELWRRHMIHTLLWQNGYIWIDKQMRAPSGRVLGLYNLLPDRTKPIRDEDTGELFYETHVEQNGRLEPFLMAAHEVIHTKGVVIENEDAVDLVWAARDAWGLALAAQGFASEFFANGAASGGILEIPSSFTEKSAKNLSEGFVKGSSGKGNWFKPVILRDGAKFHATTISPHDAELTDLSEVQVRQVARYFNLPPFKLGLEDSQSYNSSEIAQLVYLTGCLRHWLAALEASCTIKLLREDERRSRSHFLALDPSVLLETDTETLIENLTKLRSAEVINANEVRAKLKMTRREDEEASKYQNPNTSSGASRPGPPAEDETGSAGFEPTDAQRRMVQHALSRVGRRVASQLGKMDAERWRREEPRARRMFADDMRPMADALSDDGKLLCERWEAEFFTQIEDLLAGDADRDETLGQTLPESIARRLGESNGVAAD